MGLRTRLLVFLLLPTILTIGGFALWRTHEDQRAEREEFRQRRTVMTRAIEVAIDQALQAGSTAVVEGLVRDLVVTQTYIVRVRVLDDDLRPVVDSSILTGYAGIPPERLRHVMQTGQPEEINHRWAGQALRSNVVPLRTGGTEVAGVLEIVYLASAREVDAATVASRWGVRAGILFAVLAAVIAFVLQRQVFAPLAEIGEAIRRLGRGDSRPRVPVRRQDELGRVAAALNDLTERLDAARRELETEAERSFNLEQQLRRSQTLSLMGKLASSIAHEVGTPLGVISGRAEFIRQALPANHALQEDADVILAQTDRIAKIIRSVLDPLRRDRGPELKPATLGPVVEDLLPLIRPIARRRGIRLSVTLPPDLPPVLADTGQLQQVLINLLVNGFDAARAGDSVSLTARRASGNGRPGVAIAVTDSGPGMPPDVLARIFEPFFTTKTEGGTGLGLAICRDIIKAHHGQIAVDSQVGVGTTFTIELPEAGRDGQ
jgi:signal transduction histidine kinase